MQKSIGIYQSYICKMGGVETFLYNFAYNLRNYYNITIICCDGDQEFISKLRRLVKVERYDSKSKFEFNIVIRNGVWGPIPHKLISTDNAYIEMRHADYKWLQDKDQLKQQYSKWDKVNKIVACGEFVAKQSNKVLGDKPQVIKNILLPKKEVNKVLNLVTFSRLDKEKGWDRMLKMCSMMLEHNIKFKWDIYTNDKKNCSFKEVTFRDPIMDNSRFDYIANADYTVLLSDAEGLPYTVQESLQYDTPCIVTDVGGCTELIKEGVNGYVVPLDMNFDITKILNIPKISNYDNKAKEKWIELLGESEYKECEKVLQGYKVRARDAYTRFDIVDGYLGYVPKEGTEWIIPIERLPALQGGNKQNITFVDVIEEIYE